MWQTITEFLDALLGIGQQSFSLTPVQMAIRAVTIYLAALTMLRLGNRRFMGRETPFDIVLAIMIGSLLSRAITGQSPILPTLAAAAVLFFLDWLLAILAFHSKAFARLAEGSAQTLIADGRLLRPEMRKARVTEEDLLAALRMHGKTVSPSRVELAQLERNGKVSVIPRRDEPRIVDVRVADGVQLVRIELRS